MELRGHYVVFAKDVNGKHLDEQEAPPALHDFPVHPDVTKTFTPEEVMKRKPVEGFLKNFKVVPRESGLTLEE